MWIWNAVNRHGYDSPAPGETGTAAEFVAVPQTCVSPLPGGVGFDVGACLGVPALTEYWAVLGGDDIAGKTVLVQGGAGAV
ncbi:NADPH:quinone reductase, partial [Gordonia sp. ABSL11-1]|nr:NADPH:quinone reductase [Gordonia sp. ABSL11-1]